MLTDIERLVLTYFRAHSSAGSGCFRDQGVSDAVAADVMVGMLDKGWATGKVFPPRPDARNRPTLAAILTGVSPEILALLDQHPVSS